MVRGWISTNHRLSNLGTVRIHVPASRDDGWPVSKRNLSLSADRVLYSPHLCILSYFSERVFVSINRLYDATMETRLPSHAFNEMSLRLLMESCILYTTYAFSHMIRRDISLFK